MVAHCVIIGCLGSSGYPSKCKDTKTNDLGAIIVPQHWSELNHILQDLLPSDDELICGRKLCRKRMLSL